MAASTTVTAGEGATVARARVVSLDVLRGAVIVLMAIDHVRVYSVFRLAAQPRAFF
jgi:uncharacterized membrane protein